MARQSQLVSQHLENISHEALSKYQDVISKVCQRAALPTEAIEDTVSSYA
jgi:hypothetical protein